MPSKSSERVFRARSPFVVNHQNGLFTEQVFSVEVFEEGMRRCQRVLVFLGDDDQGRVFIAEVAQTRSSSLVPQIFA